MPVLLPILFCAVVFVVVVAVTPARCRQFVTARVDVAVAPVLCAVEIRRLKAIRLLCQMAGISKFSSGRQVASANNLIDHFFFFDSL